MLRTRWILVLAGLILFAPNLSAQNAADRDTIYDPGPWKTTGKLTLGIAQSAFTSNWASGDKGSYSWISRFNFNAERQFTRTFNWSHDLRLAYGETANQIDDPDDPGSNKWARPEKTEDQIQYETIGRFHLRNGYVDPYLSFRYDSFFFDESDPVGSIAFNPMRFKEAGGITRVIHKTDKYQTLTRVGFGFRQTYRRSFTDDTGDNTTSGTTNDGGFEWQTDVTEPLFTEKIVYNGQLLLFWPIFYSEKDVLEQFDELAQAADPSRESVSDFWKDVNVNFQNTFSTNVTKWLGFTLFVQAVYQKYDQSIVIDLDQPIDDVIATVDSGIRKQVQFKQTLALSVNISIF